MCLYIGCTVLLNLPTPSPPLPPKTNVPPVVPSGVHHHVRQRRQKHTMHRKHKPPSGPRVPMPRAIAIQDRPGLFPFLSHAVPGLAWPGPGLGEIAAKRAKSGKRKGSRDWGNGGGGGAKRPRTRETSSPIPAPRPPIRRRTRALAPRSAFRARLPWFAETGLCILSGTDQRHLAHTEYDSSRTRTRTQPHQYHATTRHATPRHSRRLHCERLHALTAPLLCGWFFFFSR